MTPAARPPPPAAVFSGGSRPSRSWMQWSFSPWGLPLPCSSLPPEACPWASPKPTLSSQGSLSLPTSHPDLSHLESAEATRGPLLDISVDGRLACGPDLLCIPIARRFPLLSPPYSPARTPLRRDQRGRAGDVGRSVAPRPRQTSSAARESKALQDTPLLKSLRLRGFQPSLTHTPLRYTQAEWGDPSRLAVGAQTPR